GPAHAGGRDLDDRVRRFEDPRGVTVLETHVARAVEDSSSHGFYPCLAGTCSSHRVPRFLVQLLRAVHDVRLVDLLRPVLRFDFFDGYRDGLLSVVEDVHDVPGDCFGEPGLLPFGLPGPELHDDMRHCPLLRSSWLRKSLPRFERSHVDGEAV